MNLLYVGFYDSRFAAVPCCAVPAEQLHTFPRTKSYYICEYNK